MDKRTERKLNKLAETILLKQNPPEGKHLSLKELFDTTPLAVDPVVRMAGISRQWLSVLLKNNSEVKEQTKRAGVLRIQIMLRSIASQMQQATLTPGNAADQLHSFGISVYKMGIIPDDLQTPEVLQATENTIRQTGKTLENIVITDYIEHDEVAQYMVGAKKALKF